MRNSLSDSPLPALCLSVCALAIAASAQPAPAAGMTVAQAVEQALRNYPAIRVTQEQVNAAAAGIRLAQTAYLPRVDAMAQVNRATRNTFFGLLLPQSVIPSVGAVPSDNFGSVWDSGVGVLVSWQPFDLGLRAANVAAAAATRARADAEAARPRYDVSVATADAFLTALAAGQTTEAAQASVERWQALLRTIHALTVAELRPAADESRLEAELALAQIQVAQAAQAVGVARATLAQFLGVAPPQVNLASGRLLAEMPADAPEPTLETAANPLAVEQKAAVAQAQSQLTALSRTYAPQFSVQGLAAARGTGLLTNGSRLGGLNGLLPNVQNYAIGFTVTFGAMDKFALNEREAIESANIRAGQAQSQLIDATLEARFNTALATFDGAKRIAANTPVAVSSARIALNQATARYQAGLAPIDDVAQAQRLLVQAQIDDSLARLSVWRARLEVATARGDIQPFLAEASR